MDQERLPPINKEATREIDSNWNKVSQLDFKKMTLMQKSRFWAYEEPPKPIQDACYKSKKRVMDLKNKNKMKNQPLKKDVEIEKDKHTRIIGQLKAAEARNRIRAMRLCYEANRAQEISHLIACQPVALKAVRLQALVPPVNEVKEKADLLDKFQRQRVEALLEDTMGLLVNRST